MKVPSFPLHHDFDMLTSQLPGLDPTHNPEYTTCEFYAAYANLEDLITTTEELFKILATLIREQITNTYRHLPPLTIDFTPPFARLDFIPTLETARAVSP